MDHLFACPFILKGLLARYNILKDEALNYTSHSPEIIHASNFFFLKSEAHSFPDLQWENWIFFFGVVVWVLSGLHCFFLHTCFLRVLFFIALQFLIDLVFHINSISTFWFLMNPFQKDFGMTLNVSAYRQEFLVELMLLYKPPICQDSSSFTKQGVQVVEIQTSLK